MNFTPDQIDEQIHLERQQISGGIDQLRTNTRVLEKRTYASATAYGIQFIERALPDVIARLESTRNRIREGKVGASFAEIHQYLSEIESEAVAAIGLKVVFDYCFSHDASKHRAVEVTASVGKAIEKECQMRWYEAQEPDVLRNLQNAYWHKSAGTDQKHRLTSILMNRRDIRWPVWKRVVAVKLGVWVVDAIIEATGWFTRVNTTNLNGKRLTSIEPDPEFLLQRDAIMAAAEKFACFQWPMLVHPADWAPDTWGGYLLNEATQHQFLVRRSYSDGRPCVLGNQTYEFINRLQKVAYRLNPFVVEVAETLFDRKVSIGKFHPILELELPPKPLDIADNYDARKSYRREAAQVMNMNAQQIRRSSRTRSTMQLVKRFKDVERFWLPWSFDYRGRVYPIPSFLTPQDTDFGKSLLRFADEAVIGNDSKARHWLSFQVATSYGLDKATIQDRIDWVSINEDLITRVAVDPIGNLSDWCDVEEPWQFLAACDEFYHCFIIYDRHTTGLPVAVDATCSGLQILAGLARDQSTAKLVNVLPGEAPQDAYRAVAEVAKTHLPENLAALLDRRVTKRTVMTIPYNAKPFSNRQYIRAALKEKEAEFTNDDLKAITKAVIDAMNEVVPGPMAVMRWINQEISNLLKEGVEEISWTTPSGFVVRQRLMKPKLVIVKLKLMGTCKLVVGDGHTDEIDVNRHKAATAPNLIHSLDASLLHLSFANFELPFTVIHDSVLCRATDMDELNQRVRHTYKKLFAETDFLNDFAKQIGSSTPPPIIGDFDPSVVGDSTYFFC